MHVPPPHCTCLGCLAGGTALPAGAPDSSKRKLDSISLSGVTPEGRSVSQSSMDAADTAQSPVAPRAAASLGSSACGGSLSNLLFPESTVPPAPGESFLEHPDSPHGDSPRETRHHVRALPPLARRAVAPAASAAGAQGEVFTLSTGLSDTADANPRRWAVRRASTPCGKTFEVAADIVSDAR